MASALPRTVRWEDGRVVLIEQNRLPMALETVSLSTWQEVEVAIRTMVVRGAPAIGCTAALGLVLAAQAEAGRDRASSLQALGVAADGLRRSRPTAVNLFTAIDDVMAVANACRGDGGAIHGAVLARAQAMLDEDEAANRRMGGFGAGLVPPGSCVLTHCNAGGLATVAYGTALGVIRAAWDEGRLAGVYADETRPRCQGMRLTAFELMADGIPVTVVPDSAAAVLMREGRIGCVVVGADRITANGDTANKIGTYSVAVNAAHHGVPFYVAAPRSTFDLELADGAQIPIEERTPDEVTHVEGVRIAPEGCKAWNPAFDVTPAALVTAFITEVGILRAPYAEAIRGACGPGNRGVGR